jgi:hypothetical protein
MPGKQPTIQNFIASMNKSGGFARTSRYAVVITPPSSLEDFQKAANAKVEGAAATTALAAVATAADEILNQGALGVMLNLQSQVNLHCDSISMPGHDLQAQDQQYGSAPGRQIVQSHDYAGTIDASFYLDSHLRERHFFEAWQKLAVNTQTHKANYYDSYIGSMEIYQLDANGEITYGIKATEVYPATIAGIEYAYANTNQLAKQVVKFEYRQWYNMTEQSIAGYRNSDSYNYILRTYAPGGGILTGDLNRESLDRTAKSLSGTSLFSSDKSEQKRQEQLRTPEIDRQDSSRKAGIKEAKRQEQLRPPLQQANSSINSTNTNEEAIARGLGYESAAALKTALRNRASGL